MEEKEFDSIIDIIENSFKKNQNKIAIIENEKKYIYSDLKEMSDIAVAKIKSKGLSGKKFALYVDKSVEFIALVIAIWKTGGIYIPIDTEMPKTRIDYMIQDSNIDCIIKNEHSKYEFEENQILIYDFFKRDINMLDYDYKDKIKDNDIAYIIYTSGSTGNPKGVKVSNNNLVSFMYAMNKEIEITDSDKWLSITTVCFDISILEMFFPIIKGITLVIGNKRMLIDMKLLKHTIEKEKISIMQATPITWNLLISSDVSILKDMKVLCGGDKMDEILSQRLYNAAKDVWNLYGPTETTIWSSMNKLQYAGDISIGLPIEGTKFYLFDKNMNLNDNEGELYIGGLGVSQGYVNNVVLTNQKYIKNPLNNQEIIYQTGDYVKYYNEKYYCMGRNDFQIKLNGHRIELEDIEKNLMLINEIQVAVVIPNNEKNSVFAFVKSKESNTSETEIKENLRNRLVEYMIPKRIFIVNEMPLTFNKKIDKKALLDKNVYKKEEDTKKKETSKNQIIEIWNNIIGEKIELNKPYSEYMIDSLTLTKLSISMEKIWKDFSIEDIIKYKTLNNIIKHKNENIIINKTESRRIDKILKKYKISLKDVKIQKINEIEKMMLNFYFLNPKSYIFQDCYIFEICKKLDTKEIKYEFITETNKLNYLKSKYIFGQNIKIQSEAFKDIIKYEHLIIHNASELEKVVNKSTIETNSINDCSIRLKTIIFENNTYLIFNYPHIRMDELSFFDLVNAILNNILEEDNYIANEVNKIKSNRNINIKINKYQKEKCIEDAKKYNTNINSILEFYTLRALKRQYKLENNVHYILNPHYNVKYTGNTLNICSANIKNIKNLKEYIATKKILYEKKDHNILFSYNDISNSIIGNDFIKFEHIENNDFSINIEIYNKKNTIEINVTLKESDILINLEKLKNDFYENLE